jgi:hypothetical protein
MHPPWYTCHTHPWQRTHHLGILNVLAFGDVHALGNVHTVLGILAVINLSILAPLVVAWCCTVIATSCK